MRLMALRAIYKIASRTGTKIWARSSQDNLDHDPYYKLAMDLSIYSNNIELKKKIYINIEGP